jgi:hypothetical protein
MLMNSHTQPKDLIPLRALGAEALKNEFGRMQSEAGSERHSYFSHASAIRIGYLHAVGNFGA